MAKKRTAEQDEVFTRVLKDLEEDLQPHGLLVKKYDERYRAYRGVIEPRSPAAAWTNKQHPPVALESVETISASLLDPSPKWRLRACPIMGDQTDIETSRMGARANELLLSHQLVLDKYAEKQRAFGLQGLILGSTGAKQYWLERRGPRRQLKPVTEPIYGTFGNILGTTTRLVEHESEVLYRDDPTSEVVDMRDLILPENAVSLARSARVQHRMWFSYEELQDLQAQGVYGPDANGEDITSLKEGKGFGSDAYNREQDLFGTKRNKDLIEVVECWTDRGRRVVTIGNRKVLLSDKPNPFWFDSLDHPYPFVITSGMPDLFRVPGISEVELMQDLQEMLWTLMNQRLDSLQLQSNSIFLVADDVEDPDSFEFAPGERWLVPRPVDETVKAWAPDINVPRMTLEAEALIRTDIRDITGGVPFSSDIQQGINRGTATGMSIITTLAQRRLAAKKQQFTWASGRIGEQWCALNQQFIRDERLVPVIGRDGVEAFEKIRPEMIQGIYSFQTEAVEESMMRQERRAEAQAKLQTVANLAGVFAALAQGGQMPMPNLKAYVDDYLEAFDVNDKERYWSEATPPQLPQPQPGQPQGAPGQNGQGGVTNPGLAAGPQAPSNSESLAPEQFMQQMLAGTGGPVNTG